MSGTAYRVMAALLVGLLLSAVGPAAFAAEESAPNLARNPGFEEGAEAWSLPKGFGVVQGASSHSGGQCLHFTRRDATSYDLASQHIEFRPGGRYLFSAWIRTRGVVGPESGATVCMEWSGSKGWIGGTYPDGRKGDAEWFQVTGITPPIPKEATGVSLTLYLRKGMTGEAWFDDVEVHEYAARPMEAYIVVPAYRGLIFDGELRPSVDVCAELAGFLFDREWRARHAVGEDAGLFLGLALPGAPGRRVPLQTADKDKRRLLVGLPSDTLPVGRHKLTVSLEAGKPGSGGSVGVPPVQFEVEVLGAGKRPRVYIDGHRRTIVNGRPFFPVGFYLDTIRDADLEKIAAAGFNCVMPYAFSSLPLAKAGELLDVAQRRGIKVIYSVKDLYAGTDSFPKGGIDGIADADAAVRAIVGRFRSHPAVLAWYLNDELPATMRDTLETRYRLVRHIDPDHPTWAVLYQVDELADYRHTCDVLGTSPYPIPDKPVTMAADWARKTRDATGGACAFWQVPQVFDWANYHKNEDPARHRPPTYDEMRVMTYLALVNGAKGLIYYSFYDLKRDRLGFEARWKDVSRLGDEMRSLTPALLSADAPPAEASVSGGPAWAAFRDGRRVWVLAANTDRSAAALRLSVPAGVTSVRTTSGRALAVKDGAVLEELRPLACETFAFELP